VYYAHCDLLRKAVEPGARVTIVAESNDPLLSYVLSPFMTHRLVQYRPQRLERIVADGDFDYLALVSDTARFPLEDAVRAVEASAALGRPVLQRTGLLLYRNARRPGRGGASE
jgi:hypothetical protein